MITARSLILIDAEGRERHLYLRKKLLLAGSGDEHDVRLPGLNPPATLAFTLHGDSETEIQPGRARVLLNRAPLARATRLRPGDLIEWEGGRAVYLRQPPPGDLAAGGASAGDAATAPATAERTAALEILQNIGLALEAPGEGAPGRALQALAEGLLNEAGAEYAFVLAADARGEWTLSASARDSEAAEVPAREALLSDTILNEALRRREPVVIENLIGHPWSGATSIIAARLFSVACLPLLGAGQARGAVFLGTRSPGRQIRTERLPGLRLLATQATLLIQLGARAAAPSPVGGTASGAPAAGAPLGAGMASLARQVEKLAPSDLTLLLLGETGAGKEVLARRIHAASARARGPFVAVNCAAIPTSLLESTLFGHEKGAFTGADRAQPGKFALANHGTLFLDEIGDLGPELQAKLLRALQEREIEPVGARAPVKLDLRVLAATHQPLERRVAEGKFRQDLFFRLNGASLRIPPLRERLDELPALVAEILESRGDERRPSAASFARLRAHPWPGNVRELHQVLARASVLSEGSEIEVDLEPGTDAAAPRPAPLTAVSDSLPLRLDLSLPAAQREYTRRHVGAVLETCGGSRSRAAHALGVSERTLYRLLET